MPNRPSTQIDQAHQQHLDAYADSLRYAAGYVNFEYVGTEHIVYNPAYNGYQQLEEPSARDFSFTAVHPTVAKADELEKKIEALTQRILALEERLKDEVALYGEHHIAD